MACCQRFKLGQRRYRDHATARTGTYYTLKPVHFEKIDEFVYHVKFLLIPVQLACPYESTKSGKVVRRLHDIIPRITSLVGWLESIEST